MSESEMDRRDFLKKFGAGIVVGVIGATAAWAGYSALQPPPEVPEEKPWEGTLRYSHYATEIVERWNEVFLEEGVDAVAESVAWASYREKMLLGAKAAKAPYDVYVVNNEWVASALVAMDALLDIKGYGLLDDSYLKKDLKEDFLPISVANCYFPGYVDANPTGEYWDWDDPNARLFGIPLWMESDIFHWREDWFEEAGIGAENYPKTWDELLSNALTLTDPDKDRWGIGLRGTADSSYDLWTSWIRSWGAKVIDEDLKPGFNNDEGIEATQYWVDLFQKHHVAPPGTEEMSGYDIRDMFKIGKLGMGFSWGAYKFEAEGVPSKNLTGYSVGPIKVAHAPRTAIDMYAIPKNVSNPENSWKFIEWVSTPEIWKKLVRQPMIFPPLRKSQSGLIPDTPLGNVLGAYFDGANSEVAHCNPQIPTWGEINTVSGIETHNILTLKKTVEQGLADMEAAVTKIQKDAGFI